MNLMEMISIGLFILLAAMVLFGLVTCMQESQLQKQREEQRDPCPKCGSKKNRRGCIDVSYGYQYEQCGECGHKFKDTSDSSVTVSFCADDECHSYVLDKPEVDEDGGRIYETESDHETTKD